VILLPMIYYFKMQAGLETERLTDKDDINVDEAITCEVFAQIT